MSMDPTRWISFEDLSQDTRKAIEAIYPYLKLEKCMFQDKATGVFMKAVNNVKIEKLLDPESMRRKAAVAEGKGKK